MADAVPTTVVVNGLEVRVDVDRHLVDEVLLPTLAGLARHDPDGPRRFVFLAAPPGTGKSTLAAVVGQRAAHLGLDLDVVGIDGFHHPQAHLDTHHLRGTPLAAIKGAPETFDVAGLRHMLERLRRNDEAEIAVPVFDRELEIARAGARLIPRDVDVLIVEGNYILLDQSPWSELAPLFDVTVNIHTSRTKMRQRLVERWQNHGIAPEDIAAKVEANDLPNGELVLAKSIPADFVVTT